MATADSPISMRGSAWSRFQSGRVGQWTAKLHHVLKVQCSAPHYLVGLVLLLSSFVLLLAVEDRYNISWILDTMSLQSTSASASASADTHYALIVDAGSSGTRAHLFHLDFALSTASSSRVLPRKVAEVRSSVALADELGAEGPVETTNQGHVELRRIVTEVVDQVRQNLQPRSLTSKVLATAGFRMLPPKRRQQAVESVKQTCNEALKLDADQMCEVRVLTGAEEASLAWDSARAASHYGRVGIVEVGGASVQVAIPHRGSRSLYAHSYLGYGAHAMETSLNSRLAEKSVSVADAVESPCGFYGHQQTMNYVDAANQTRSVAIDFTGDFDECLHEVQLQIDKESAIVKSREEALVAIPELLLGDTHVYGLAMLFHVPHFINVSGIGQIPTFPIVPIHTFAVAGRELCKVPWPTMKQRFNNSNPSTSPDRLSNKCFEAALLVAILLRLSEEIGNALVMEVISEIQGIDVNWAAGAAVHAFDQIEQSPGPMVL